MKVKELMERASIAETGRAIAYIKDALDEMNLESETHTKTANINVESGKRYYDLPKEAIKVLDIRCKHQNNASSLYRGVPRTIYEPETEDTDGY